MGVAPQGDEWAVILAAGDGTRLASLTRLLHGEPRPKQFAEILSGRSLLQMTVERVAALIPPERMVVVASAPFEALARRQLADWQGIELVAQPANRGTAPGILLPLTHVQARDPGARALIFPSDHYLERAGRFLAAARRAAAAPAGRLALVGAVATSAEQQYGWIVPDPVAAPLPRVLRFVEKPDAPTAMRLWRSGALWNTFVVAGALASFWSLARRHLPTYTPLFAAYGAALGRRSAADLLQRMYAAMPEGNFSRAVLEQSGELLVARASDSGWCDWGTPERVIEALRYTPHLEPLLRRIAEARAADAALPACIRNIAAP
jgi:mannose-1-phosphate guanylyltransferase